MLALRVWAKGCAFPILAMALGGCVHVGGDAGFSTVREQVSERIGKQVEWWSLGVEETPVDAALEELLADELDADEAVQVALLNNPRLQGLYEELGIAKADLVEAGLLRNPVFDGEVKFVEAGGGEVIELGVTQPFLEVLYIPLRRRVAERRWQATQLRVAAEVLAFAGEARRTYYRLLAARERVGLMGQVEQATGGSFQAAEALFEAGNIPELDVRREQAIWEQVRADLARSELQARVARVRLNELMGLPVDMQEWQVPDRLPGMPESPVDLSRLQEVVLERNLKLGSLLLELDALGERLGLTRVESLAGEGGGGAAAEREPDGVWAVGPALELEVPIFDFGQADVPRVQARVREAYWDLGQEALRVRSRLEEAMERVRVSREQVDHYHENLFPVRQEVVEQTQKQYNAMQIGVFQLLEAKRNQIETARGYVDLLEEYWLARTDLSQIMSGGTAPGGMGMQEGGGMATASMGNGGGH